LGTTKAAVIACIAMTALTTCSGQSRQYGAGLQFRAMNQPALTPVGHAPAVDLTQRVLNVPLYHQAHRLSCEAAALRMALAYEGIKTDELTLIAHMGDDLRPARLDSRGRLVTWGDPMAAYVGNPDGRLAAYTGYGVYYGPVARAAQEAGAAVLADGSGLYGAGIAPADIYRYILEGHPVVAWISNTYHAVPFATYVAYDGATVRYTLTEHAVTLIGVRPDALLINDPWFGQAWHSKAQFESAYRTFAEMAVVLG
jgi:uncharacterized protein YvpB